MSYTELIASNVKAEAKRRGVKNRDIADCLGFSTASLGNRFSGKTEFRPSEIEKIARLLDVPIAVLTTPVEMPEKVAS